MIKLIEMKKIIFLGVFIFVCMTSSFAQKYAYVDTDFILGKLPAYVAAQEHWIN